MLNLEIFDVCGTDLSDLYLLAHLNEDPDDWETYSAAVVRLQKDRVTVVYRVNEWIQSMWRSENGALFLASVNGDVHVGIGDDWRVVRFGREHSLNQVWGLDDGNVFCCGGNAGVYRGHGTSWEPFNTGLPEGVDVIKVGGHSLTGLRLLGKRGLIFRHNGQRWTADPSPTNQFLTRMLPLSDEEMYVCGWKGAVFHQREHAWSGYDAPVDVNFYGLVHHEDRIWLAGAGSGVFAIDGPRVVSVEPDIAASGLTVIDRTLIAHFESTLHLRAHGTWSKINPDFSELTG